MINRAEKDNSKEMYTYVQNGYNVYNLDNYAIIFGCKGYQENTDPPTNRMLFLIRLE